MPKINPILQFIDEMMKQAGYDNLPEGTRKLYRQKLAEESQKRLAIMAMAELSSDLTLRYMELVEKNPNDMDAIMNFFTENIPDFEQKTTNELIQFGKEFIETSRKMRSSN